jgi:lipopolysaccharide export system ATP-binding protein
MMSETTPDGRMEERELPQDLSSLVALRALAAAGGEGEWLPLAELVTALRLEFAHLAQVAGAAGPVTPPAVLESHPLGETPEYLRQHTLPALEAAGLVEVRSDDGAVRLAGAATGIDVARVDREILQTVAAASPAAVCAPISAGLSTLSASGLVKVYRKRRVVNDVAIHVSQGEIVGLLGPNGAGKTTTFYMMVGLIAPDAGKVLIGDENVTGVPMYQRARRGIGYLAQEPSIFRKLTVEENVLAILQMLHLPRDEQRRRLETLLDELGIKHLRRSMAYALSGGERRRLEITRALVGQPKFMLLDEPFAGVDPIAVHDIQQIVSDLRRREIGVLISDHNVEQTLDIVDRAYIMYDGRVRVSGTVSELVWNDEVAEIYLGPTLTARMRQRYTFPE